jgi:hypothetical protein
MAKQVGHILIQGTIDGLTYYKMDGVYYVRKKSSLSRMKVLKSPRFERTRMHASQLAEASKIASAIYKEISKEKKSIDLFRSIVGKAKVLLASGKSKEKVLEELRPQKGEREGEKSKVKGERNEKREFYSEALFVNGDGRLVGIRSSIIVGEEHQQRRKKLRIYLKNNND